MTATITLATATTITTATKIANTTIASTTIATVPTMTTTDHLAVDVHVGPTASILLEALETLTAQMFREVAVLCSSRTAEIPISLDAVVE